MVRSFSTSCFVILLYLTLVAVPDETAHDPHLQHCASFNGAALGNLRRLILFQLHCRCLKTAVLFCSFFERMQENNLPDDVDFDISSIKLKKCCRFHSVFKIINLFVIETTYSIHTSCLHSITTSCSVQNLSGASVAIHYLTIATDKTHLQCNTARHLASTHWNIYENQRSLKSTRYVVKRHNALARLITIISWDCAPKCLQTAAMAFQQRAYYK